jgi:hypothetical protein
MRTQGTLWGGVTPLCCLLAGQHSQSLSCIAPQGGQVWRLVAWYLSSFQGMVPLPVVAEMLFLLWCYLNNREHASLHPGKLTSLAGTASVVWLDGLVLLCGSFQPPTGPPECLYLPLQAPWDSVHGSSLFWSLAASGTSLFWSWMHW